MAELVVCRDSEELNRRAADLVREAARRAVGARGHFSLVLSGGSTPRSLYELLAREPYRDEINWRDTHVFWGDERCVGPDHRDSNYRMALESLLSKVPVREAHIHRMRGEEPQPDGAARDYEREIRAFFGAGPGEIPAFDLVLLGMGEDAHTASLFPSTQALHETRRLVAANYVEKLGAHRLTLTPPVLQAARELLVLVSGGAKAGALASVLEGPLDAERYPSQLLREVKGRAVWVVDAAAASQLRTANG